MRHHLPLTRTAAAALVLLAGLPTLGQAQTFTVGTELPSAAEQSSLSLLNRFRADPQGELARLLGTTDAALASGVSLSSTGTAGDGTDWSSGFWTGRAAAGNATAAAMDYFRVSPGDLLKQWSLLPTAGTLHPLSWNANLGSSSQQYANLVVADNGATSNPHTIAPYSSFGFARYTDAGYVNASTIGENIARSFPTDATYVHSGFAVDWGGPSGGNGIQNPAGHRNSILSSTFTEVGIGIASGPQSGTATQVQHFGDRFDTVSEFLWGYAWADAAGGSYSFGEGLSGLTVNVRNSGGSIVGSATTDANGGYTLQVVGLPSGTYAVEFRDAMGLLSSQSVAISNAGLYQVNMVSVVPEPQTWALMLGGGLMLLALRRRQQRSA